MFFDIESFIVNADLLKKGGGEKSLDGMKRMAMSVFETPGDIVEDAYNNNMSKADE